MLLGFKSWSESVHFPVASQPKGQELVYTAYLLRIAVWRASMHESSFLRVGKCGVVSHLYQQCQGSIDHLNTDIGSGASGLYLGVAMPTLRVGNARLKTYGITAADAKWSSNVDGQEVMTGFCSLAEANQLYMKLQGRVLLNLN